MTLEQTRSGSEVTETVEDAWDWFIKYSTASRMEWGGRGKHDHKNLRTEQ